MSGNAELATSELAHALFALRGPHRTEIEDSVLYQAGHRLLKDAQAFDMAVLIEALDTRCMWINPETFDIAADEIDCCSDTMACHHSWHESDTNAAGCSASERGDYCPNDVAETLRAIAKCARAARKASADQVRTEVPSQARNEHEQKQLTPSKGPTP